MTTSHSMPHKLTADAFRPGHHKAGLPVAIDVVLNAQGPGPPGLWPVPWSSPAGIRQGPAAEGQGGC